MNRLLFSIVLTSFAIINIYAQNFNGLKFKSHEVDLEERTSLVLLEKAKVNANKSMILSTDILFNKSRNHYFGYVLRMIDSNHRNIDIVYNYENPDNYNFSLIYDHEVTPIQFNFKEQETALNKWTTLTLEVDVEKDFISLAIGTQKKEALVKEITKFTNLQYYFGANNNPYFKVHDVAPITIKNIQLQLDDLKLQWPLNEKSGVDVHCNQGTNYNGIVKNGIWLEEIQTEWKKLEDKVIDASLFYFNEELSYYYYMKEDTLYKKNLFENNSHMIVSGNYPFLKHHKVRIIEKKNKDIIFYNLAKDDFYTLTAEGKELNKININYPIKKSNTQHTSWLKDDQSSIVLFGGYGNYEYSDILAEINLNNKTFHQLEYKGDTISPRYLAGNGKGKVGHHYIFGGYGSKSGKQIAHPENYYDLYDFNEKTGEIKEIARWQKTEESYVVSRNIIVDTLRNQFLALTYDNHVHNNQLELRLFDISSQTSKIVTNAIPFNFKDIKSVVELKYDKEFQTIYAIVLNKKGNTSRVQIYALDVVGGAFLDLENHHETAKNEGVSWIYYTVFPLLFLVLILIVYKFISKNKTVENPEENIQKDREEVKVIQEEREVKLPFSKEVKQDVIEDERAASVINFFGGFRIIDEKGVDISNKFTPLIKQIFLLVSLSQFHNGRGVTVEQMTEVFWSDMPLKKARNNRSVNIAKIKQLFKLIGDIELLKTGDFWNIKYADTVKFPLFDLKKLLDKDPSIENLKAITKILKNGKLLYGTDYPWMEDMMAQIINGMIEKLYNYLTSFSVDLSDKEKLKISDLILKYDALNEEAIHIKCQIYTAQGMHSMAKDTFEKFEGEYAILYGEKFDLDYTEFLKSDITSQ